MSSGVFQSATGATVRDHREAPLRMLTTQLLATFKAINTRYYQQKKERQAAKSGGADARREADYVVTVGDMLGTHYRVIESMGKGSFGQVVCAEDNRTGNKVAVKVIKNREAFRRQAKTEIKLLELLNRRDPQDEWCIGKCAAAQTRNFRIRCTMLIYLLPLPRRAVRFLEWFEHNGHVCLVFEQLSFNLYELLRRTHFRGVSLTLIRKFARQILKSLAYLSLPEIDVIHWCVPRVCCITGPRLI